MDSFIDPAIAERTWDISPKRAIELQREFAPLVRVEPLPGPVRTIAGADCAFTADGKGIIAVAVLCLVRGGQVIVCSEDTRACDFPYIPGLLSFREAPAVMAAIAKLPARPDLVMIDGQGMAHPRGMGLASHVGLLMDLPTIGVAKSRLCGEHREPGLARGCRTQLRFGGRVVGSVVRTRENVAPMYVSVGHRVTLEQAVRWVLRLATSARLPEPTRQAHQGVSRLKKCHGWSLGLP